MPSTRRYNSLIFNGVLAGAFLAPVAVGAQVTSLTADPGATINFTLYVSPGAPLPTTEEIIVLRDPGLTGVYASDTWATDNVGNPVAIQASFAYRTSQISGCNPYCKQSLIGTGTLDVFNRVTNVEELKGSFSNGAIYGIPGASTAIIEVAFTPTIGPARYFDMVGTTTSPLGLCDIASGFPACRPDAGYDLSKPQFFNSFVLDWSATLTTTPFSPVTPVPEPTSFMLMLVGLIGIGKYSSRRAKITARSVIDL